MDPYLMPASFCVGEDLTTSELLKNLILLCLSLSSAKYSHELFGLLTDGNLRCILHSYMLHNPEAKAVGHSRPKARQWLYQSRPCADIRPSTVLAWRRLYLIPVVIFPVLASIVQISVVVKLDAIQPNDDLHCDANDPEWYASIVDTSTDRLIVWQGEIPGLCRHSPPSRDPLSFYFYKIYCEIDKDHEAYPTIAVRRARSPGFYARS